MFKKSRDLLWVFVILFILAFTFAIINDSSNELSASPPKKIIDRRSDVLSILRPGQVENQIKPVDIEIQPGDVEINPEPVDDDCSKPCPQQPCPKPGAGCGVPILGRDENCNCVQKGWKPCNEGITCKETKCQVQNPTDSCAFGTYKRYTCQGGYCKFDFLVEGCPIGDGKICYESPCGLEGNKCGDKEVRTCQDNNCAFSKTVKCSEGDSCLKPYCDKNCQLISPACYNLFGSGLECGANFFPQIFCGQGDECDLGDGTKGECDGGKCVPPPLPCGKVKGNDCSVGYCEENGKVCLAGPKGCGCFKKEETCDKVYQIGWGYKCNNGKCPIIGQSCSREPGFYVKCTCA